MTEDEIERRARALAIIIVSTSLAQKPKTLRL